MNMLLNKLEIQLKELDNDELILKKKKEALTDEYEEELKKEYKRVVQTIFENIDKIRDLVNKTPHLFFNGYYYEPKSDMSIQIFITSSYMYKYDFIVDRKTARIRMNTNTHENEGVLTDEAKAILLRIASMADASYL